MDTRLKQHRKKLNRPLGDVAQAIGVNRSTLYRIECGVVAPSRETARALFNYYAGRVPLAHIYDPEYATKNDRKKAPNRAA